MNHKQHDFSNADMKIYAVKPTLTTMPLKITATDNS